LAHVQLYGFFHFFRNWRDHIVTNHNIRFSTLL
jgi:hypothetical protein